MEVAGAGCKINDLILLQLCGGTQYVHKLLETSTTLLIPHNTSLVVDGTHVVSALSIRRKHMSGHSP
jgi:hypothetical protein